MISKTLDIEGFDSCSERGLQVGWLPCSGAASGIEILDLVSVFELEGPARHRDETFTRFLTRGQRYHNPLEGGLRIHRIRCHSLEHHRKQN